MPALGPGSSVPNNGEFQTLNQGWSRKCKKLNKTKQKNEIKSYYLDSAKVC